MKNSVLVMGGNGFIGSNIVNYFLKNGENVIIYDRTVVNKDVKTITGNLIDDDDLESKFQNVNAIIYLINCVSPKDSMENPSSSYINEIPMLLKVLEVSRKLKINKIIFASSGGTVYGDGISKFKESDDTNPINHYAICKLACEKILLLYNKLYNMDNVILRISNPYGIGQSIYSGIGAITNFIVKTLNDEKICLYGDGKNIRDFVHIDLVSEAFYKAYLWKNLENVIPIFNIGSGQGFSLIDIVDIISNFLNKKIKVEFLPSRDFDVKCNVLDVSKSIKYLDLNIMDDEIEYIKEYINYLRDCGDFNEKRSG